MGWLELQGHLAALNRLRTRKQRREQTDPDSWAGYEADGWWAEQRRKADQLRGR